MDFRMQVVNQTQYDKGNKIMPMFNLPLDCAEIEIAAQLKGFPNCVERYRIVSHHTVDEFFYYSERPSDQSVDEWNEFYYMMQDLLDVFGDENGIRYMHQELRISVKEMHSFRDSIKRIEYSDKIVEELLNKYGRENVCIGAPYSYVIMR